MPNENINPTRWFQFSLRTMFLIVALTCVGFGWWRQSQKIAERSAEMVKLNQELTKARVSLILAAAVPDEIKLRALAPYVKIGGDYAAAVDRLGPCWDYDIEGDGPGMTTISFYGIGLIVLAYPDGEIYGIGYVARAEDKPGTLVQWLYCDEPVTWPKSVQRRPPQPTTEDAEAAYTRCLSAAPNQPPKKRDTDGSQ